MSAVEPADRWMRFRTRIAEDRLLLASFRGREAVSELYDFQLELLAENDFPVRFDELLGERATVEFSLREAPPRFFHGIVKRLRQLRRDETYTHYRVELAPAVWQLTRNRQNRIFQQKTVQQILTEIFAGFEVSFDLRGEYSPHNYCVQYQESDFAFASRLMEEEGIYYYFKHSEQAHQMVIADASATGSQHVEGMPEVRFDEIGGGTRNEPRIDRWEKDQVLPAGHYTLWDHSFQLPKQTLAAEQALQEAVSSGATEHRLDLGSERMAIFEYPGGYGHRFDQIGPDGGKQNEKFEEVFKENDRLARIRMEAEAAQALRIEGAGNCASFAPGFTFTLADHFDGDGEYLIASVAHEANNPAYRSGGERLAEYRNSFEALPAGLPYRPPRATPRPRISGTQTASVVGQVDEPVGADVYGRVKVQFHWDRFGKRNQHSSCWVRVAWPWAGDGWGMITIPRVGQEVVVAFEEGDPDAPLIVGSVYNADQMPPFELPAERTRSGIKTRTDRGSAEDFHGLAFDDAKGRELLHLRSQKDMLIDAKHDHTVIVPHSQFTSVGHTHMQVVGGFPGLSSGSGAGGDSSPARRSTDGGASGNATQVQVATGPFAGSGSGGSGPPANHVWGPVTTTPTSAFSISATMGVNVESVFGASLEIACPTQSYYTLDPLGMIALGVSSPSLANVPGGISTGLLGYNNFVYGANTEISYGPKYDIHRGPEVLVNANPTGPGWHVLVGLHTLSILTAASYPHLTAQIAMSDDWNAFKRGTILADAACLAAGAVVAKYEAVYAKAAKTAPVAIRLKNVSDTWVAKPLNTPEKLANAYLHVIEKQQRDAEESANVAGNGAWHTFDGAYSLSAKGITMSSPDNKGDITILGNANNITIGNTANNTISLSQGAKRNIVLSNDLGKQIHIQGPLTETILLEIGDRVPDTNKTTVKIANNSITLQTAPGGKADNGSSITLDGKDVTIKAGTDGTVTLEAKDGGKLTLSKDGAKLESGDGKSSVDARKSGDLNLHGKQLAQTFDTKIEQKTAKVSVKS